MKKGLKIFVAGSITWFAIATSFNGIFEWEQFPWERYQEGEMLALYTMPPLTFLIGYVMMKWAFGPGFIDWLKLSRPTLGSLLFFVAVSIAAINSNVAASNSDDAVDMAAEARDEASEANTSAQNAASNAREAASSADILSISCRSR